MEKQKITIHDLAAKLNLSASTVSRALSGHSRISETTKSKVQKAAAELNYKPNYLAASFRKGCSSTIGIVVPRINRHFFSHVISGIESVTNSAGYNVMICQTNENFDEEKRCLQTLINNRVDGIIMSIAVGTKNASHVKSAIEQGIPVVQFDRVNTSLNTDKVLNDNISAAYEVTRHLIEQGYKRIVHAAGPLHNNVYADRCEGFKKAMTESGLPITKESITEVGLTREDGCNFARQLYENKTVPQAVFSSSDYSALGMFIEFKRLGFNIPNDIAIAGFANEPFTEFIEPGMTTLEQFGLEMGRSAAKLLIERLESEVDISTPRSMTIKPKLIVRGSTSKTLTTDK